MAAAAVAVVASLVTACAAGSGDPASTPTTAASSSPTQAASVTLPSTHYPYALTLPADHVSAPFAPAQEAWDGEGTITRDSTYVDRVTTRDGTMYIFGIAWDDDAEALAQMFADRQADAHGCSAELANRRDVTIDATPAVGFFTSSCGPQDSEMFARLAIVHDGFGLIAFTPTTTRGADGKIDSLVAGMAGVEWTRH